MGRRALSCEPDMHTMGKQRPQAEMLRLGGGPLTPTGGDVERLRWLAFRLDQSPTIDGFVDELRKALLL